VVPRTSYPAFNYKNENFKLAVSKKTLSRILRGPLEFEVYHSALEHDERRHHFVGVARVDVSQMIRVEGVNEISAYFHILREEGPSFDSKRQT